MTNNPPLDRASVEACIKVARQVQRARNLAGDKNGSDAARQIALFLEQMLTDPTPQPPGTSASDIPR